jgi:hypothetical protein
MFSQASFSVNSLKTGGGTLIAYFLTPGGYLSLISQHQKLLSF